MKIALLVPSRERADFKQRLINSLILTANSTDNFTLYFGVDDDDPEKELALKLTEEYNFVKVVEIHNEGKFIGLSKIWNQCARESTEEILSMIGDDMIFISKNWDTEIINEFTGDNLPKDKIKMVYCRDGHFNGRLAVNHFLHRRYLEINGYYMREEFMSWGVDTWIHLVFRSMNRHKYRNDIHIEHKQHGIQNKSQKADNATSRIRSNGFGNSVSIQAKTYGKRLEEVRRFYYLLGIEYNPKLLHRSTLF